MVNCRQDGDHLRGGVGGAFAGMAVLAAGPVPRLLLGVGRKDAEDDRQMFGQGNILDSSSTLAGDEIEMRRVASDDAAEADHCRHPARPRQRLRRQRKLEGARNAVYLNAILLYPQLAQASETALEQFLDDGLIESRRHHPHPRITPKLALK